MSSFVVFFLSQNHAVVENKRVLPVLVPGPRIILHLLLLLLLDHALLRIGTHLKNGNFTNSFRIGWKSAYYDQIVHGYSGNCIVDLLNATRIITAES